MAWVHSSQRRLMVSNSPTSFGSPASHPSEWYCRMVLPQLMARESGTCCSHLPGVPFGNKRYTRCANFTSNRPTNLDQTLDVCVEVHYLSLRTICGAPSSRNSHLSAQFSGAVHGCTC